MSGDLPANATAISLQAGIARRRNHPETQGCGTWSTPSRPENFIDVAQREVRRQDACVPVEPEVLIFLLYLVENRARVAKDELVERIWNGRAISDAALSSCVKAARRTLGDDGQQQRFIRTINRRGFRFVGPVETHDRTMPAADVQARSPKYGAGRAGEDTSQADAAAYDLDLTLPAQPSVAVLPICALGDEDQQALLADGLTHDLTVRLARTRWLFVTARASAARYHASAFDPVEIGRRLGVRYLLGGSLRAAERHLRLTIALSDTVHGGEIWADRFDCAIDDIFAVQDEIGDRIVAVVKSEIERVERQRALLEPLASLDAWSAYHRARHHLYCYTAADCDRAERYPDLAARLDPHASRVLAGLSFVHWQRAFLEIVCDRSGATRKAFDCARHSVALDPPRSEGALGSRPRILASRGDRAGRGGTRSRGRPQSEFCARAIFVAFGLAFGNDSARGFDHLAKARRLSPYDPMTYAFLAVRAALHGLHGEPQQAVEWARRALLQPNAHYHIQAVAAWCHQAAATARAGAELCRPPAGDAA